MIVARRRLIRRRFRSGALTALAIIPILSTILLKPRPILLWNLSESMPRGLYHVRNGVEPRRGDLVVAWAPGHARALAAERRYLPSNIALLKQVAARSGDRICAEGPRISTNGRTIVRRVDKDSVGRPLPRWHGCRVLGDDEYLLLGRHRLSFDGRYFGVTGAKDIIGLAERPWSR